MENSKDVKVFFYSLIRKNWKKKDEDNITYEPLYVIYDLLIYINKLRKTDRFIDLKNDKFCFLEGKVRTETTDNNIDIISGFFKSARSEFRPNLINKRTGNERPNPKEKTEGDIEKTHFSIKIDKDNEDVILILEHNPNGLSISNIIDYLNYFNKNYLKDLGVSRNYSIIHAILPKDDFLEELNKLDRAKIAEVFFNKQLLGSKALNFSNRMVSLKNDIRLTAYAEPRESIKELVVDLFNAFNGGKNGISKLRVLGSDSEKNPVILDTNFMNKVEFTNVELNDDTGEINTTQMYSQLKHYANSI